MVTAQLIASPGVPYPLTYVVIAVRYEDGWLFVRHRKRGGYEMPAGHPDPGEDSVEAAVRELMEETGAIDFTLEPVTYYWVDTGSGRQYGRLFLAYVETLGEIPDRDEIEWVKVFKRLPGRISLPEVMTLLYGAAVRHFRYTQR
ncbi:MAG: NUDIX domain-containing protein [Bacteroidales bacterium]